MSTKEFAKEKPVLQSNSHNVALPAPSSGDQFSYQSRLEKIFLGSYDKLEELTLDTVACLFSKNPQEVIIKNIQHYEAKNGESVFGKMSELGNKSNFSIILSIIPLDSISNMTFGTALELTNIVRDEIQYQSYAVNKDLKREEFLELKQTKGLFKEVDATLGIIEALGCGCLVVASGGTNISALNKTWKFCRVFGVNLTSSALNAYADELLAQTTEENSENSKFNFSRMASNTALSMGNSAIAGGIIRLAGMGYYSQMKNVLLPKVSDAGKLTRGGLALDRAMERYNRVASLVDTVDDYGDLKEGLLCFSEIKDWNDTASVKKQLLAATIKTLTAAHGAIEWKTSGITDFSDKSSGPDLRVNHQCYGINITGRMKADGSICFLDSKEQLHAIFNEWTKETRREQGFSEQQIHAELQNVAPPNSFYDPKTARIYTLEICDEMSAIEKIEVASWQLHEYVHREKGVGKHAEILAYQAQLAFLDEQLLPYGYSARFKNSQLVVEQSSASRTRNTNEEITNFVENNYNDDEVLARSTSGDNPKTSFVSGNCLAGLNQTSIESIFTHNPRAVGWKLFINTPSMFEAGAKIVNVGPGIFPFDSLEIAETLKYHTKNPEIYVIEQNSALAHAHITFDPNSLIADWEIKQRMVELGHKQLAVNQYSIRELILRVDKDLKPTSLVAKVYGDHDTADFVDVRYYTVDTAPDISFRRLGKDIIRTPEESLITRLNEKYQRDWLPALELGENLTRFNLKIQFQPLRSVLSREGINLITIDNLSELALSEVTCFTVFNLLVHLSLEERATMLKDLGRRLKEGGIIGIRHEEKTFMWQRVGNLIKAVPRLNYGLFWNDNTLVYPEASLDLT